MPSFEAKNEVLFLLDVKSAIGTRDWLSHVYRLDENLPIAKTEIAVLKFYMTVTRCGRRGLVKAVSGLVIRSCR